MQRILNQPISSSYVSLYFKGHIVTGSKPVKSKDIAVTVIDAAIKKASKK